MTVPTAALLNRSARLSSMLSISISELDSVAENHNRIQRRRLMHRRLRRICCNALFDHVI